MAEVHGYPTSGLRSGHAGAGIVSRRRAGLPWAPTSLPPMRQQWCDGMAALLGTLPGRIAAERAAGNATVAAQWES